MRRLKVRRTHSWQTWARGRRDASRARRSAATSRAFTARQRTRQFMLWCQETRVRGSAQRTLRKKAHGYGRTELHSTTQTGTLASQTTTGMRTVEASIRVSATANGPTAAATGGLARPLLARYARSPRQRHRHRHPRRHHQHRPPHLENRLHLPRLPLNSAARARTSTMRAPCGRAVISTCSTTQCGNGTSRRRRCSSRRQARSRLRSSGRTRAL